MGKGLVRPYRVDCRHDRAAWRRHIGVGRHGSKDAYRLGAQEPPQRANRIAIERGELLLPQQQIPDRGRLLLGGERGFIVVDPKLRRL
jgi:hypothetical protein